MIKKSNKIFDSGTANKGIMNVFFTSFLFLLIGFYFTENWVISLIISVLVEIIFIAILHKRWFSIVRVYENGIEIKHPLILIGKTEKFYLVNEIKSITYFPYMSSTPSHCKLEFSDNEIARFNCIESEFEKIKKNYDKENIKLSKNEKYSIRI